MRKTMICLVVSLVTLVGTTSFAHAQRLSRPPAKTKSSSLSVGVTGLLNLSTAAYSGDGSDALSDITGWELGFGGGLRVIYEIAAGVGIQPEVLIKQYGFSMDMDLGPLGKFETSTTLNYLEVPVLVRYTLPLGSNLVKPKVLVGPTFGYLLSGSAKIGDDSEDLDLDGSERFSVGIAAGLGADIAAGPGSVSIDLRFDRGFTKINKVDDGQDDGSVYNTGFSFMLGYNYAF